MAALLFAHPVYAQDIDAAQKVQNIIDQVKELKDIYNQIKSADDMQSMFNNLGGSFTSVLKMIPAGSFLDKAVQTATQKANTLVIPGGISADALKDPSKAKDWFSKNMTPEKAETSDLNSMEKNTDKIIETREDLSDTKVLLGKLKKWSRIAEADPNKEAAFTGELPRLLAGKVHYRTAENGSNYIKLDQINNAINIVQQENEKLTKELANYEKKADASVKSQRQASVASAEHSDMHSQYLLAQYFLSFGKAVATRNQLLESLKEIDSLRQAAEGTDNEMDLWNKQNELALKKMEQVEITEALKAQQMIYTSLQSSYANKDEQ